MYKLKQIPEDFIVEEIPKFVLDGGEFNYFLLEKKNWATKDIVKKIADKLRINQKYVNIAGNKDKDAITKQYISIYNINPRHVEKLKIKDTNLKFIGKGKERLKLGQLKENKFKITVRNLDSKDKLEIKYVENYYDEQRFGMKNSEIGCALIKKEFDKACSLANLNANGRDYVGALRSQGKRVLRFYTNSYQSNLFNKAIFTYLKSVYKKPFFINTAYGKFIFSNEIVKNRKVPIVGFLTELKGDFKKIYEGIIKEEGILLSYFLIKQMPEISSEGNERDLIKEVYDFNYNYGKDELNKGKLKTVIEFSLDPGSYATLVIKKLFH